MNDQLKQKLLQYLSGLENLASDAVLAGKQEIPAYIQELIRWEIFSNLLGTLIGVILFGICVLAINKIMRCYRGDHESIFWIGLIPAGILVGSFMATFNCLENAGKAYFAPRVFLVEKISTLVKP